MKRTARITLCLPLVLMLGCHSTRTRKMAAEPNAVQAQAGISIDNRVSPEEPNTLSEPEPFTLSGSLGTDHVTLRGLPGDPNTLANGTYSVTVNAGWSGTVTPEKEGFLFSPPSRTYDPFTRDIHHEIYLPRVEPAIPCPNEPNAVDSNSQSLTGVLKLDGVPIQGIILRTLATSMAAATDANGFFSLAVPREWQGTLRLQAPEPALDTPDAEAVPCECDSGGTLADATQAADGASVAAMVKKEACAEAPLITLGTPCLPDEGTGELAQDLHVMCQLLSETAFGISLVKRDPNSEPRAIYLPGDGVLFNICIGWPLAGPLPEPKGPEKSSRWRTAREYIQQRSATLGPLETLHDMKTQAFIQKMTHCLIHGANIRRLEEDSHITLHVSGPPPSEDLVIRAPLKAIKDYAEAVLTGEAFEQQVMLKLH
ncbi:MAG: hypothetical protein GY809_03870 [Planctomycetes bacterium]|nr:hypothetical protein [Planctomycetota bacterium]